MKGAKIGLSVCVFARMVLTCNYLYEIVRSRTSPFLSSPSFFKPFKKAKEIRKENSSLGTARYRSVFGDVHKGRWRSRAPRDLLAFVNIVTSVGGADRRSQATLLSCLTGAVSADLLGILSGVSWAISLKAGGTSLCREVGQLVR